MKKEKSEYSFGIFDALVCVTAILLCVALYGIGKMKNDTEKKELFYTVTAYNIKSECVNALNVGDEMFDDRGKSIGNIRQINILSNDYDDVDEYSDIEIKILAYADVSESAYKVNGCEINVGAEYEFCTSGFHATGKCTSLQIGGENNG